MINVQKYQQIGKHKVTCQFIKDDGTKTRKMGDLEDIRQGLTEEGMNPDRVLAKVYFRFAKTLIEGLYPNVKVTYKEELE